jgi:hypothetical protein
MRSSFRKLAIPLLLAVASPVPAATPAADVCKDLMAQSNDAGTPPVIKPAGQSVRVLAFGDFGDGSADQLNAAGAMRAYHQNPAHPFDFGMTLGDNFYEKGLNNTADVRWRKEWETPYGPMNIRIYASLGNHDYNDSSSPTAEALYSQSSRSWCLPRAYYTYTAGPVQFFVLDTEILAVPGTNQSPGKTQKKWLEQQLQSSKATWKVVYGHHPIYSAGYYSNNLILIDQLLPLLMQYKVDVYLAGHDHTLQYLKPVGGVHFFVSGAGGHSIENLGDNPEQRRIWGAGKTPGFTVLEADAKSLTVSFFDSKSNPGPDLLCKVTLIKGQDPAVSCPP